MTTPLLPKNLPLDGPLSDEPGAPASAADWLPLLDEPFASSLARTPGSAALQSRLQSRLQDRVNAALRAAAPMHTVRRRHRPVHSLAPGVSAQTLHHAQRGAAVQPGEPGRITLLTLAPGAAFSSDALGSVLGPVLGPASSSAAWDQEWLLLSGQALCDGVPLAVHDYHVVPAGQAPAQWVSAPGASVLLRESAPVVATAGDAPLQAFTQADASHHWQALAPGIQRRVLWRRGAQAALLYRAQAGAQIPSHQHGHAEECLVLEGELFLDDVLLQAGDYQLAPVGTGHRMTETDIGVVIYAHGDAELQFV